jgi:hypothetical protein
MAAFDCRPYGLNFTLTPAFDFYTLNTGMLRPGHRETYNGQTHGFTLNGVYYTSQGVLGTGSFGETHLAASPSGRTYAIKYLRRGLRVSNDLINLVKEALIQILIVEESRHKTYGPYAPILHEIAYDPRTNDVFIRSELMRNTFHNLLTGFTPAENDRWIPNAMMQLADIFEFLGSNLQFNHRDFKTDNCMYVRKTINGVEERVFKLIDFGFSCLTWNGLKIYGGDYFARSPLCYKQDRDLAQFLYSVGIYPDVISAKMMQLFDTILEARVKNKSCNMLKTCKKYMKSWSDTYTFMNRVDVAVRRASPSRVHDLMEDYENRHVLRLTPVPVQVQDAIVCPQGKVLNPATGRCVGENTALGRRLLGRIAGPADCGPGKLRNPVTRRCVKVTSAAGRRAAEAMGIPLPALVAPPPDCPPGKIRNARTGRCKKIPAAPAQVPCPPGKIRNPTTGRCVKDDGWLGHRAAVIMGLVHDPHGIMPLDERPCPPGKVRNPATRRCVKEGGVAAKKLLRRTRRASRA